MPGPNDLAMAEPDSAASQIFNFAVHKASEALGYDTNRVTDHPTGPKDNSFYRDNAQHMPGWENTFGVSGVDPHGLPSGATAQDRATNYVGQDDKSGIWSEVRRTLVEKEQAAICELPNDAHGMPSGNLSFRQVYDAHVASYDEVEANHPGTGAANGFVDPGSFAIAMYGAPLLENAGINSGPATGASIDLFNDPTDSATGGWAKRMALNGGEMITGAALAANAQTSEVGAGLFELGAFGAAYNTNTALEHGMLDEMAASSARFGTGVVDGSLLESAATTVLDLF